MTGATYGTTPLRGLARLAERGHRAAAEEGEQRLAVIEQALRDEGLPREQWPHRALALDAAICATAREEAS